MHGPVAFVCHLASPGLGGSHGVLSQRRAHHKRPEGPTPLPGRYLKAPVRIAHRAPSDVHPAPLPHPLRRPPPAASHALLPRGRLIENSALYYSADRRRRRSQWAEVAGRGGGAATRELLRERPEPYRSGLRGGRSAAGMWSWRSRRRARPGRRGRAGGEPRSWRGGREWRSAGPRGQPLVRLSSP